MAHPAKAHSGGITEASEPALALAVPRWNQASAPGVAWPPRWPLFSPFFLYLFLLNKYLLIPIKSYN
jgi:hypothetical protein